MTIIGFVILTFVALTIKKTKAAKQVYHLADEQSTKCAKAIDRFGQEASEFIHGKYRAIEQKIRS